MKVKSYVMYSPHTLLQFRVSILNPAMRIKALCFIFLFYFPDNLILLFYGH